MSTEPDAAINAAPNLKNKNCAETGNRDGDVGDDNDNEGDDAGDDDDVGADDGDVMMIIR